MSFDQEWNSARVAAVQRAGMELAGVDDVHGDGSADYKVTSPDLRAIGNAAQTLYHGLDSAAYLAGAATDTGGGELDADGFATGSAMWAAWDTWRQQSEALLSACALIHNHLEDTVRSDRKHEETLVTNFSWSRIEKHFT